MTHAARAMLGAMSGELRSPMGARKRARLRLLIDRAARARVRWEDDSRCAGCGVELATGTAVIGATRMAAEPVPIAVANTDDDAGFSGSNPLDEPGIVRTMSSSEDASWLYWMIWLVRVPDLSGFCSGRGRAGLPVPRIRPTARVRLPCASGLGSREAPCAVFRFHGLDRSQARG